MKKIVNDLLLQEKLTDIIPQEKIIGKQPRWRGALDLVELFERNV